MSYNGSGTFVVNSSGQPVVTGTVISSTAFNALTADLATGLSTAITKDGQTTTTSRILFAQGISSTLTTDATSTTTGSIITAGGISTQKALWVGTTGNVVGNLNVGGTNNVATGVISVGVAANAAILINGRLDANTNTYGYQFVNGSAGTAAATLAVLGNGTNALQFNMFGTAWTTSGIYRQGGGLITCDGPGGLTLATGAVQSMFFAINSVEKMKLDSVGNLGIGMTATSYANQTTVSISGTTYGRLDLASAGTVYGSLYAGSGGITLSTGTSLPVVFETNGSERGRFDSSGNLLVGTTTTGGWNGIGKMAAQTGTAAREALVVYNSAINGSAASFRVDSTTSNLQTMFYGGSVVGTITTNGTTTAYNTSSDARLKINVSDADPASALIDAIQVRQFDWKSDNSHQRYGMIAQELLEIAPDAVHVPADPEQMMGVDYSKLVPMLIKEVQSLRTRLAALENK